jgi:hypothetical protein
VLLNRFLAGLPSFISAKEAEIALLLVVEGADKESLISLARQRELTNTLFAG